MLFGITILCMGAAMGIIAGLGQTTSTAACSAIAGAAHIKVGTAMMFLYSFFLILQLGLLGRAFRPQRLFQLIPVFLHGWILNFFKYSFGPFQSLHPQTYPQKFLLFFVGMLCISLGFTIIKCSRFVNYPPEEFCSLAADRLGIRFGSCKIILDFAYVATALLICWLFALGFGIVREGTLIFSVCNGILINLFQPPTEKLFQRLDQQIIRQK